MDQTLASSLTQSKKDNVNTINDSEKQIGKANKDTKDNANKDKDLDDVSSCEEDDSDGGSDSDGLEEDTEEDGGDDDTVYEKGLDEDGEDGENSDDDVDRIYNEDDSGGEEGGEKEDFKESSVKPGPTSFGDAKSSYTVPNNHTLYSEFVTNKDKISKNFRDKTLGAEGSEKLTTFQPPRLGSIRRMVPNIDKFLTDGGVVGEKTIPIVVPKPKASSASASGLSKVFTDDKNKDQGQSKDQGPQGQDQTKGQDQVNKDASDDVQVKNRLKTFKEQIGSHASGSGITSSLGSLGTSSPGSSSLGSPSLGSPSVSFGSTFQRPTLSTKFSEKPSAFINRDLKQNDSASNKPFGSTFGVAAALNTKKFFNPETPSLSSLPSFPRPKALTPQVSSPLITQAPLRSSVSSSLENKTTAETLPALPQKKSIPASNPIQNTIKNDNGHGGPGGHGGRDEDSDEDDDDKDTNSGNIGANEGASNNRNARGDDAASDQKDQQDEEEDQHEEEDQDEDEDEEEEEEEEETLSDHQRKVNELKSRIWLQAKSQQLVSGCKDFPFKTSDSLETMTTNLKLYKKYLQLNRNIENCTSVYMLFMALTEEVMCMVGLDAEGYAQFQMERIDEYKPCLMVLGEKGYFCNSDEEGNVVNPWFQLLKLFALNTSFFMLGQYGSESVKALAGKMSVPMSGDRGKKRRFEEVEPSGPPGGPSDGPPPKLGLGQKWLHFKEPLADMKQLGFERARTMDEFRGRPFANKGEDVFNGDTYYVNQKPPAADQEDQDEDTNEDDE